MTDDNHRDPSKHHQPRGIRIFIMIPLSLTICSIAIFCGIINPIIQGTSENFYNNSMNPCGQRIIPAVPHVATTTSFASVGGNAPLYFIPVTITNNQAGSTVANLQVKIVTNPNASSSYYSANLSNINWQDGNGHILNSWLENGSSNLATSAVYWVNLSSNIIAGSGGTIKIYEVIYDISVNAMNIQTTGAYPSYSSTYGQYDAGQYVFQKYYNFYGTSLPGTLTMVRENTGFSYTVNNGLSIMGISSYSGDNQGLHIYTTGTGAYNIAEMYLTSASLTSSASWELSLGIDNPSFGQSNDAGFTSAYRYDYLNGYYRIIADNSGTSVYGATTSASLVTPAIETLSWPSRGSESGQSNGTQKVAGTDNTFSYQNTYLDVALVTSSQYTSSSFQVSWLRTRLNPPSGVMPSILIGSLTSVAISNTVVANPTTIDQSQSSNLTATVSGGFFPYTYQWLQKSPGSGSFITISGATSINYTFTTNSSTITGAWQLALQVNDTNGTIFITPFPATVQVNSQLWAPTVSMNFGTIDLGQSAIAISTEVITGTSPYVYQWLNSTNIGGPYISISGANIATFVFTPWVDGTWYIKLNVTDSAGVPVRVTSNTMMVVVNTPLVAPAISVNYGTIDLGQSATLSSTAITTGTPAYSYQWLNSTSGGAGTYAAIPGATSITYIFTPWAIGIWYLEFNVTDSAGVNVIVTSNAATVIVNSPLVAPNPAVNYTLIDQGQNIYLTASAGGNGTAPYTFQWYSLTPGAGSYSLIIGATTENYTFLTTTSTPTGVWYFKLNVTDSSGIPSTVTTTALMVNINSQLQAPSIITFYGTINQGQLTYLSNSTSISTGTPFYSPQWYSKAPGAGSYSLIAGGNIWNYTFSTSTTTIIGTWNFALNVTDSANVAVTIISATIVVIVNDIPQFVARASNITYTYGQTGNLLSWTVGDTLSSAQGFTIYVNGTSNATGMWITGNAITKTVDYLWVGWYNYSIIVTDGYGGTNTTWAYVLVLDDTPQISQPTNLTYTYGQTNQAISWTINDFAYKTTSWKLFVNNTLNATGIWIPGLPIMINVSGLWVGWANYSLLVDDGFGRTNSTWANITILNDIPMLNHPPQLLSILAGTKGNYITWIVTDGAYIDPIWVLFNNVTGFPQYPTPNATGYWSTEVYINISIDNLPMGTWNWTFIAYDGFGGSCFNEIFVNVSNNPAPSFTQPLNVLMMVNDIGYSISWTIIDLSNDTETATYWIYQDSINLVGTGLWAFTPFSNTVTIPLSNLAVGIYNFTIIADNGKEMRSQDECTVTVNDNPVINHPASIVFNFGTRGHIIAWTITDVISGTCSFTFYVGGSQFAHSSWVPVMPFNISLDTFAVGTYNYIIVSNDGLGGQTQDTGTIVVNDFPVINQQANKSLPYGSTDNILNWIVSDSISTYRNFTVFVNGTPIIVDQPWNPGNPIAVTVNDTCNFGIYVYTIFVDDGLNGTVTSTIWITVLDDDPVITNPQDVNYHYGTTGHVIEWVITHRASQSGTYTVSVGGVEKTSGSWTSGVSIQISVDSLGIGSFEYVCFASDGLKNCSDMAIVTVLPDIPQISTTPVMFTFGTVTHNIAFNITATYLASTHYTIYVNGTQNATGTWTPGLAIVLNLDDLWVGTYNYSIIANNGMGEIGTTWAIVTVLDDIPQISPSPDITFYVGNKNNEIRWTVIDGAYTSKSYVVYINGTTIYETGVWNNDVPIPINVDSLNVGIFNFSCVVNDGLGGSSVTYILVIVNPLIPGIANPLTIVVQTHVQRDNASFSFALFEAITLRPYPPSLTNITISFGLGNTFDAQNLSWKIGTSNGEYTLTIDTRSIPAGTYLIRITFSRQNYTDVSQVVTLTVIPFEPVVELPQGILSFTEGSDVMIKVMVTDIPLLNQTFDAIKINWALTGTTIGGSITTVNSSGGYYIKFNTGSLQPNTNYYLTISIEVLVSGVTYSMSSPQAVNIRVEYITIFGIPQPYFWVIVVGIIAAITIFPLIKLISYARLPPTVKRINEINYIIKNNKKVTPKEIPSDNLYEYFSSKYRDRWEAFKITPLRKPKIPRSTKEIEKDA